MSERASAFLSVRLPSATRDRLKAAAAARGGTVQELVGSLVDRFLAEERRAPDLAAVTVALRSHREQLAKRGVTGLWIFGSVARGEAHADSDIDLLAQFTPDARLSVVGLASLRSELSELLGAPADLVERESLHAAVRAAAEKGGAENPVRRRTTRERLEDIRAAATDALAFAGALDEAAFAELAGNDRRTYRALKNALSEIGEAVKMLPADLLARHQLVDWRGWAGLRDLVSHQYFSLELSRLRPAIVHELPLLLAAVAIEIAADT